GQQCRLPLGRLLHGLEHVDALIVTEHRALAERTAGDESVAAGIDLQSEAALHLLEVERAIFVELGGDRWNDALPHDRSSLSEPCFPRTSILDADCRQCFEAAGGCADQTMFGIDRRRPGVSQAASAARLLRRLPGRIIDGDAVDLAGGEVGEEAL